MKQYLFQSERLGFRDWADEDLAPFAELNADNKVMEFFPKTFSVEETQNAINRFKTSISQNGFGFFAVDTLHNSEFIGFIGLNMPSFSAHFTPCIEIGWRLKTSAWNQGYATEGALRCIAYGFKDLGITQIFSFTSVYNLRSERVMQKAGMIKQGEFLHPKIEDGHKLQNHVLYSIKK